MFPVADQFSLAFDAVGAEQLADNEELKSFYDGVKMTQSELLSAFERNKVSEGIYSTCGLGQGWEMKPMRRKMRFLQ